MSTNAQLRALVERLTETVKDAGRRLANIPKFTGKRGEDAREWLFQVEKICRAHSFEVKDDNSRLPGIAGSAMERPALGWFLYWLWTTIPKERVLHQFESSMFRVEDMGVLDQIMHYTNGLKHRTRSYVKLEDSETLADAMDLAVPYEVTNFKKSRERPNKPYRERIDELLSLEERASKAGKRPTTSVEEEPDVERDHTRIAKPDNDKLNDLCENPLVYKSRPLFTVEGNLKVEDGDEVKANILFDSGATAVYVSKNWALQNKLSVSKTEDHQIRINKLGDKC
ncbi:TPA: hypothetical protein N0F65_010641 [Lagenidium giganteum]|uniref:Uncharacterized protein n=1 Tax=Lagenidium giganteum TaxID=4803 RepID=A0AAV2Z977_9STRA|nr:TPA: hypothetical protein N0F65_010641 [Lagenidium giganteum]